MKRAADTISYEMVEEWVKDLVYTKTYCGLKFQSAIIAFLAEKIGKDWRLANVAEEAQGIDGYIGNTPIQIKSITYKMENRLPEAIDIPIVYYDKKKDGISIEYDPLIFQ